MTKEETKLQNAIRVALSEYGFVRRNNVGTFLTAYGTPITIGVPGESDLTVFCKGGRTVFLETKTPTGRQSKAQKHFEEYIKNLGYEYYVVRSVEDALRIVEGRRKSEKG